MPPAGPPRFLFVVMLPAGVSAVSGRMYKVVAGPVRFGKCTTAECFVYCTSLHRVQSLFSFPLTIRLIHRACSTFNAQQRRVRDNGEINLQSGRDPH